MALNQAAINIEVINGSVPVLNYLKSLTVSSTSTSSFLKRAGAIRSVISTSAVSLVRGVRKLITYTSTSTATVRKAITQTARSVVSTSTAKLLKGYFRRLNGIVVTSTATLKKAVGKLVVASQSTSNTVFRGVRKILSVSDATVSNIVNRVSKNFSVSSTSIASIKKAATRTLLIISTTIASVIKKVLKTFIVKGTKTLMTGTLNGPLLNERSINSDDPTYTETTGITSTATVSVNAFYYKVLTVLSTSISTIVRAINRLKVLVVSVVTTTNSLVKQVGTQLYFYVENLADVFKQVQLVLITLGNKYVMTGTIGSSIFNLLTINEDNPIYTTTTGVTSTTTVSVSTIYYRILTSIATVTSSLLPALIKLKALVANAVTSTVRVLKQANINLVSEVLSAIETVKQIRLILITYGSKYVMTGGLNGLILNALTINEESPPNYILAEGVFSTATISILSRYYKTLNILGTSISSLLTFKFLPKVLVANVVSSIVSIKKDIGKLVELAGSLVDATISTAITFLAELISLVTNTSTLAAARFFFKVLSVISTSTSTISRSWIKILTVLVNVYLTLLKIYGKLLVSVVYSFSSLFANVVYFTELLSKIYIYAEDRVRSLPIKKLRTVITDKIRTVFITKDDIV